MKLALLILLFALLFGQVACWKKKTADASLNPSAGNSSLADGERAQARVYLDQGKELYRDDRDEQAVAAYQQAIKLDPELAEAYFRLGLTQDGLGREEEAEEAYKKAVAKYKEHLKQNGDDAEAHYNLGQVYAGLSLYGEAVREYRQATRLKSHDAEIYYDLGTALTRLAQYDEAVAAYSKALEIDPENYRAEDALEEAREGSKRIRAGRKHQEDLLKKKQRQEELKKTQEEAPASTTSPSGSGVQSLSSFSREKVRTGFLLNERRK